MRSHRSTAEVTSAPRTLSDREFGPELEVIARQLEDKGSWERRLGALQNLRSIFEGDVSTKRDFLPVFNASVKLQLLAQVEDLRSAIAKEACACITALCQHSSDSSAFESVSSWYITQLLHNSCATVAVIASSASNTLNVLSRSGKLSRDAILLFLRACAAKHNVIRKKSYECLKCILQHSNPEFLRKLDTGIVKAIRHGLFDAVQETRKLARLCFWALEQINDTAAAELFAGCEPQVQRAIEAEKEEFFKELADENIPDQHLPSNVERRRRAAAAVEPSSHTLISGASPAPKTPKPHSAATPLPRQRPATSHSYAVTKDSAHKSTATKPAAASPRRNFRGDASSPSQEDTWISIATSAVGPDWFGRVNAFNAIAELAEMNAMTPAHATETIKLVSKHIGDSHYRVVAAVLNCLQRMLERAPTTVFPYLDELFRQLFLRLGDPKEVVKNGARAQLSNLHKTFGEEAIIPSLMKSIEGSTPKPRLACVEFLIYITQSAPQALASASAMKPVVMKLLNIATRGAPEDLKRVVGTMYAALYASAAETLVSLVLGMTPSEQFQFNELIKAQVPHFAQDCRRLSSGERMLPHPPTEVISPFSKQMAAAGRVVQAPKEGDDVLVAAPTNTTHRTTSGSAFGSRPSLAGKHFTLLDDFPPAKPSSHFDPTNYNPTTNSQADGFAPHNFDDQHRLGAPQREFISQEMRPRRDKVPTELAKLRGSQSSEEKRQAVLSAQRSLETDPLVWEDHFGQLLPFALTFSKDADHGVRMLSLQWLQRIVADSRLQRGCEEVVEHLLRAATQCIDDPFPEIQHEATVLAAAVLQRMSVTNCVAALLQIVNDYDNRMLRVLNFLLRELGRVCARDPSSFSSWSHLLPPVVQVLTKQFQNEQSDIRKTVVLNFVDMYRALPHEVLLPQMTHLAVSQLKLISIYHNRGSVAESRTGSTDLLAEMRAMKLID